MFASIAQSYDLLNHLLSLNVDRRWRQIACQALQSLLPEDALVLDLCTGTGDLALELSSQARVVGCDFCRPMLMLALKKVREGEPGRPIRFVEGDALELPFPVDRFDGVTIAFGLRNLANYEQGLAEMWRVLRPGGRLAVVEFSQPRLAVFKQIYLFYFARILPRIGALVSGKSGPYSYLPRSVRNFPGPAQLTEMIEHTGFVVNRQDSLTGGIVTLHLAQKASKDRH